MRERYMRSIRLVAECYHTFERMSGAHIRTLKLTPPQFDIIATLGNTPGMSFKELGEKTLITKGTLTGVIDRLEARGLVKRTLCQEDRRSTIVMLTVAGENEFKRIFAQHLQYCKTPFLDYSDDDFSALEKELGKLRACLEKGAAGAT